ncbi:MAG: peroxiredoxin family protein [Robiginitomaculum sp.]|nr:peroxiredoxin family protein [Robiginitomaculum sp.]MDQ7077742.1 peroxiredoxin family protein [Robiginitomaculum sp.]
MEKVMRIALMVVFLAFSAPLAFAGEDMAPTDRGPAVGSVIPSDLASIDQYGMARNFETLTGKNGLVLVFFRSAKWCPFCKRQLMSLAKEVDKITSRGYTLAALSYDSLDDIKRYVDEHKPGFTMLSDRHSKVIDAFGIRNEKYGKMHFANGVPHPMIFVISPQKVVMAKLAEKGYKDRPPVSAIVEAIDALSASKE